MLKFFEFICKMKISCVKNFQFHMLFTSEMASEIFVVGSVDYSLVRKCFLYLKYKNTWVSFFHEFKR